MQMTNCTMGLARDFTARQKLVVKNDRIYFSDLTDADLSGLNLSGKHFFGCILTGCNFRGATLERCRFENCFVGDEARPSRLDGASLAGLSIENCNFALSSNRQLMPDWAIWGPAAAEATRSALQGDYEPAFQEIRQCMSLPDTRETSLSTPTGSAMLALCATGLRHSDWERRLSALSLLSRALLHAPEAFGTIRGAYLAVLLYRTGDPADTVYFPALDLVETFQPDESILRHVFGRIESPEPAEQMEALRGARLLLSRYDYDAFLPLDGLERLLTNPLQPPDILREALRLINDRLDALAMNKDEVRARFTPALQLLLKHSDESIRRAVLDVAGHFYAWDGRPQIRRLLNDTNEDIRNEALMTLYHIMPGDEFLKLMKEHPPGASVHAGILAHQAYVREQGWSNNLISEEELRPQLTSADPKARLDGLYYASFLGDPLYLPELLENLRHGDPAIRTAALRAIEYLSKPPSDAELRFLENDSAEEVRTQLARTLEAIARQRSSRAG